MCKLIFKNLILDVITQIQRVELRGGGGNHATTSLATFIKPELPYKSEMNFQRVRMLNLMSSIQVTGIPGIVLPLNPMI